MLITVIIRIFEPSVGSPPNPPVRMWNETGQRRSANAPHSGSKRASA
jgi:hypothetical protein